MKKIALLLTIFLMGTSFSYAQQEKHTEQTTKEAKKAEKEAKKAEKEAKKAQEDAIKNAKFEMAYQALQNRKFVLKATDVDFKRGHTSHVNDNTNFVMLSGDDASIQFDSNIALAGPNGMGGITVEGKASNIEMKTDKKGNVSFKMNVQGTGVSALVSFNMTKGSNYCSAIVTPNFRSNRITFSGELVPLGGNNQVFKGHAL